MHANDYQRLAMRTLDKTVLPTEFTPEQVHLLSTAIHLAAAVGRFVDDVKKSLFHHHPVEAERLLQQLHNIGQVTDGGLAAMQNGTPDSANFPLRDVMLINVAMGLVGESGEFAELVQQLLYRQPVDLDKLRSEIGDVRWYTAFGAEALGKKLENVDSENIEKLWRRYPDGFKVEHSIARADTVPV